MALDTTIGGTDADSYVTVATFQTYASKMGFSLTSSTSPTTDKYEQDLRRAAIWLDGRYQWRGVKSSESQKRAWPRWLTDEDEYEVNQSEIPDEITDAQMELAYLINTGIDPFETDALGAVVRQRSKAGPVETETEYSGSTKSRRFTVVDQLVRKWVLGGIGGTRRLVRA